MKRILIGLMGAAALPAHAAGSDLNYHIGGFLDALYGGVNEAVPAIKSKFNTNGEVDLTASKGRLSGRVDTDFYLTHSVYYSAYPYAAYDGTVSAATAPQGAPISGVYIEQAYLDWAIDDRLSVDAGAFNANLGWEKEDTIDLYQTSHGQIYNFFNAQTGMYGQNVAGAALNGRYRNLSGRVALLNDLSDSSGKNSLLLQASADIVNGLNVAGSFVTQHAQAGNMLDLNSTYRRGPLIIGGEFVTAEHTLNYGWGFTAHYDLTPRYGVTGRIDYLNASNNAFNNTVSYTVDGIWNALENLTLRVEYRADDNGSWNNRLTLQAVAYYL